MDRSISSSIVDLYHEIMSYDKEISDPVEKIKVALHVKALFWTLLATFITLIIFQIVLPATLYSRLILAAALFCCGVSLYRLYRKKYKHIGSLFCTICIVINFYITSTDETMILAGFAFSIVLPSFVNFLTQSKKMTCFGLLYSFFLNVSVGPLFRNLIFRESGNPQLVLLLDSGRIAVAVFAFYSFAFNMLEDNRFEKILTTLVDTLKTEELVKQEREIIKAKTLFFSCFSHEMRNPLNCILGSMDYAIKYENDKVICDVLSTGKACGGLLLTLINNILDMGKLDANTICLNEDTKDSKAFITNIWRVTQELFKKKKQQGEIFVDRNFPANITVDDSRLSQVIVNLVSNACKFSEKGKVIRVIFSFEQGDASIPIQAATSSSIVKTANIHPLNEIEEMLKESGTLGRLQTSTMKLPARKIDSRISLPSLPDEQVEQLQITQIGQVRSIKTMHHVKTKSLPYSNRFVLLFSSQSQNQEANEWNPQSSISKRNQQGVIKIEVIDSGCGISPEELERLFKPFSQANKTTFGTYGGSGLGLYITQSLIRLMRGTINLESQPNIGSKFIVRLPNDPLATHDVNLSSKSVMKTQSPFSRFRITICLQDSRTNLSEFEEKVIDLQYFVHKMDHFVLPQPQLTIKNVIQSYYVYDVSCLTAQNMSELKKLNLVNQENTVFVFFTNERDNSRLSASILPPAIQKVDDCDTLFNSIHNNTTKLLNHIKSQYSILIIDDDDFNRKVLSVFLDKEGYKIFTAENGQVGYEVFCDHADEIGMIIVDYEMPICDGPTCAEMILKYTKDQGLAPVPIYALTGNVSQESKIRMNEAGIKKVWNKPAKLEEIMNEIFFTIVK